MGTVAGRWVITAAVLGSGVAFLDSTVVNAALPAIAKDFHVGLADLQWVVTAYLLTLGSLLVIGGSLGDLFGRRRVFVIGLVGFAFTSLFSGIAPSIGTLVAARALQGITAALLVPGSLAIISASFRRTDRGAAIGAWSGSPVSPRHSGRFSAGSSSTPSRGGWCSSSTCRSLRSRSSSRPGTYPRRATRPPTAEWTCWAERSSQGGSPGSSTP